MFAPIFRQNAPPKEPKHKEGELYKVIKAHGRTFELRYGYYEERDRQNPHAEPTELYPNFIEHPLYTNEGLPFVTAMQSICGQFKLKSKECDEGVDNTCYNCIYYEQCEELLGLCKCKARYNKLE